MRSNGSISLPVRLFAALCLAMSAPTAAAQLQTDLYRDMIPEEAAVPGGARQWPARKAARWYAKQPFLAGCNYFPRNAVNQLEMWQEETFSPGVIDQELGWAEELGFNCLRVFLQSTVWKADPKGFIRRVDRFLEIADRHGMKTMLVLFAGSGGVNRLGTQPEPVPGCHNRYFCGSPDLRPDGTEDPAAYPLAERFVKEVVGAFRRDDRVLAWDLWNEPGWKNHRGVTAYGLLPKVVSWVRDAGPRQPVTIGVWNTDLKELNKFIFAVSDIVSFHSYSDHFEVLAELDGRYKPLGRPILCTEYLARSFGSRFDNLLPLFKSERVGAICWGLVDGKTCTKWPWSWDGGAREPDPWFHDILHPDGSPYDAREAGFIRLLLHDK